MQCSVCLFDEEGDEAPDAGWVPTIVTPCRHFFCLSCILQHQETTVNKEFKCPTCRQNVKRVIPLTALIRHDDGATADAEAYMILHPPRSTYSKKQPDAPSVSFLSVPRLTSTPTPHEGTSRLILAARQREAYLDPPRQRPRRNYYEDGSSANRIVLYEAEQPASVQIANEIREGSQRVLNRVSLEQHPPVAYTPIVLARYDVSQTGSTTIFP